MLTIKDLKYLRFHKTRIGRLIDWIFFIAPFLLIVLAILNLYVASKIGGGIGLDLIHLIQGWIEDVDVNAQDPDGSSWDKAYNDLRDALGAAYPCDEIWVAEGTYKPKSSDPNISFDLKYVDLYGGFKGAEDPETKRYERDWFNNETFLSGEATFQKNVVKQTDRCPTLVPAKPRFGLRIASSTLIVSCVPGQTSPVCHTEFFLKNGFSKAKSFNQSIYN